MMRMLNTKRGETRLIAMPVRHGLAGRGEGGSLVRRLLEAAVAPAILNLVLVLVTEIDIRFSGFKDSREESL